MPCKPAGRLRRFDALGVGDEGESEEGGGGGGAEEVAAGALSVVRFAKETVAGLGAAGGRCDCADTTGPRS